MLKGAREAIVRDVARIAIHDQAYVQVLYSPVDEPDKTYQARVGVESVYPELAQGHRVQVHTLMNVVTRIEATGDSDA
ncbi:TPA: hypothetical protein DCE37_04340 [Candidatus Latescibacteria bacterium]|nr:hypothetical protein [Candidatus Latescibacterota bacterium]|tara:strand:+ start:626 stop:859 length:234 start_codon:yes stop_codon:yes gene_type:complete